MMLIKKLLIIALGGSLGAISRFLVASFTQKMLHTSFPWGTLVVNLVGSFVIGFIMVIFMQRLLWVETWHLLIVVGFLGAFTTYSSFSYETLVLFQNGALSLAAANVVITTFGCLLFVYFGALLARMV